MISGVCEARRSRRVSGWLGRTLLVVNLSVPAAHALAQARPSSTENARAEAIKRAQAQMQAQMQAMFQPPSPELQAELGREGPAIQKAAEARGARRNAEADRILKETADRIAARLKRPAGDPAVYQAVMMTAHTQNVTKAWAPGGTVLNALPPTLKAAVDGSLARDIIAVANADQLIEAGKIDEALALVKRNVAQTDSLLDPAMVTATPDATAQQLVRSVDFQVDFATRLAKAAPTRVDVLETAFVANALRKGKLLEMERRISAGIRQSSLDRERKAWSELHAKLSELQLQRAFGVPAAAGDDAKVQALKVMEDAVAKQLAGKSKAARSRDARANSATLLAELRAALPANESLIFFTRFPDVIPKEKKSQFAYAAFTLNARGLTFQPLGSADVIDVAVNDYLKALDTLDGSAASIERKKGLAKRVHDLVFAPLVPKLAGDSALRLVGDGALEVLPFGALHDGNDWLIGRYQISYANSPRELTGEYVPIGKAAPPVVLAWSPSGKGTITPGKPVTPNDLPALPGVTNEARAVSALLPKSRLFSGAHATDGLLGLLSSPSILHVAAHAVFFDGSTSAAGNRGINLAPSPATSAVSSVVATGKSTASAATLDPLLRSALVLGPNSGTTPTAAAAPNAGTPRTDGFMTAYDVATLDLWNTELVVLSACETGRGALDRSAGVRGMRTAFSTAGARSLVASLWHVRDEPTVKLMQRFYGNLVQGRGRREALHQAMNELRRGDGDPSVWAAFVLLGETGPLSSFGGVPRQPSKETQQQRDQRANDLQRLEHPAGP